MRIRKQCTVGELAVEITTTADDIEDTTAEMNDTQAFIANLASMCETKKKEWAERSQMRSQEVAAISEAIGPAATANGSGLARCPWHSRDPN